MQLAKFIYITLSTNYIWNFWTVLWVTIKSQILLLKMVLDKQCLIRPIQPALQIFAGSLSWFYEDIAWKILKPHLNHGKRMTSVESLPGMHYYKLKKTSICHLMNYIIIISYSLHTRNASIYSLIIYHTLSRIVAYLPSHLPLCASTAEWRTSLAGSLKYATLFPPTIIQMNTSGIASCGCQSVYRWYYNASQNYFPSIIAAARKACLVLSSVEKRDKSVW